MRSRARAALGSAAFFVIAPGTVAGLIPWLISRWEFDTPLPYWGVARVVGALLIIGGLIPLVTAFVEFIRARGVPIPTAPTERLVVDGFNRYVRNPMYVGLVAIIGGQALLFGNGWVLLWALCFLTLTATFVRIYEEPTLHRTYGEQYDRYRANVPGWLPRTRPWSPS